MPIHCFDCDKSFNTVTAYNSHECGVDEEIKDIRVYEVDTRVPTYKLVSLGLCTGKNYNDYTTSLIKHEYLHNTNVGKHWRGLPARAINFNMYIKFKPYDLPHITEYADRHSNRYYSCNLCGIHGMSSYQIVQHVNIDAHRKTFMRDLPECDIIDFGLQSGLITANSYYYNQYKCNVCKGVCEKSMSEICHHLTTSSDHILPVIRGIVNNYSAIKKGYGKLIEEEEIHKIVKKNGHYVLTSFLKVVNGTITGGHIENDKLIDATFEPKKKEELYYIDLAPVIMYYNAEKNTYQCTLTLLPSGLSATSGLHDTEFSAYNDAAGKICKELNDMKVLWIYNLF